MKKLLLINCLLASAAHADFMENVTGYLPDMLTEGAKSGVKMAFGLEKNLNINLSTDPCTLGLIMLLNSEQIGLKPEEAFAIKRKLLAHVLESKTQKESQPAAEPTENIPAKTEQQN